MFLHEGTAYDLASGSTDIPFVAGNTASDTSFETSDILQENTAYKIRVYDGNDIVEKPFTTKSFDDGDASSTGVTSYMGGLVAATKAAVTLTIERKPEEIMLVPYADDTYKGGNLNYAENGTLRGGCIPNCGTGVSGAYVYGLRKETNKLVSMVMLLSPQRNTSPANWVTREGTDPNVAYNIAIISE